MLVLAIQISLGDLLKEIEFATRSFQKNILILNYTCAIVNILAIFSENFNFVHF